MTLAEFTDLHLLGVICASVIAIATALVGIAMAAK